VAAPALFLAPSCPSPSSLSRLFSSPRSRSYRAAGATSHVDAQLRESRALRRARASERHRISSPCETGSLKRIALQSNGLLISHAFYERPSLFAFAALRDVICRFALVLGTLLRRHLLVERPLNTCTRIFMIDDREKTRARARAYVCVCERERGRGEERPRAGSLRGRG